MLLKEILFRTLVSRPMDADLGGTRAEPKGNPDQPLVTANLALRVTGNNN